MSEEVLSTTVRPIGADSGSRLPAS